MSGRLATATVLAAAASVLALLMPLVLKWIADGPVAHRDPAGVWLGGGLLLALGAAEAGIFGVRRWLVARPLAGFEAGMRQEFYRHVQRLPVAALERWSSGQLLFLGIRVLKGLGTTVNRLAGSGGGPTGSGTPSWARRIAQADEFVRALPDGADTRLGEQGMTLSGGQRQRLALARAVAARPRLLVLDDPLSALDIATEALVEAALRRVLATTTALLVAHRPSTALLADRVALLSGGRIVATGTHRELLKASREYAALMTPVATP